MFSILSNQTTSIHVFIPLYPYGKLNLNRNCVSVFLMNKISDGAEEIKVHYKISFVNDNCNHETEVVSGIFTFNNNDGHGCTNVMSREELLNNDSLLVDDTLWIRCELRVDPYSIEEFRSKSDITNDLENLYFNGKFSDLSIQIGRRKFKVHKSILAARSETFANMLRKNQENIADTIKLSDITYEVMNEVLSFIYCEKVNNLQKLAMPLLEAAHKYKVNSLKVICEKSLFNILSDENAIAILKTADSCGCPELKSRTIQFIVDNIGDIIKSNDFKLLKYQKPNLLEEILCAKAAKD